MGWHTARTLLPPPPPRSSGAPVRWLMARGRRASGVAAAPRSRAAGAPATRRRRAVGGACACRARSNGRRRPLVVVVVVVVRTPTPNYLRQASPDRGKYCSQTRVSSATSPPPHPLLRVPRGAGPSHLHTFLERWEAGLPPVHFCGRNSHHSTAGHTERMAATPLRPRHRCEAHTNPHHSWRQREPCVKISHPLVDGADTTRLP